MAGKTMGMAFRISTSPGISGIALYSVLGIGCRDIEITVPGIDVAFGQFHPFARPEADIRREPFWELPRFRGHTMI